MDLNYSRIKADSVFGDSRPSTFPEPLFRRVLERVSRGAGAFRFTVRANSRWRSSRIITGVGERRYHANAHCDPHLESCPHHGRGSLPAQNARRGLSDLELTHPREPFQPEFGFEAAGPTVDVDALETALFEKLDGECVGYSVAIFVNGAFVGDVSGGDARRPSDLGALPVDELPFTANTRMGIASCSKFSTALAVAAVLESKGLTMDEEIQDYLPSDWDGGSSKGQGRGNVTRFMSCPYNVQMALLVNSKNNGFQTVKKATLKILSRPFWTPWSSEEAAGHRVTLRPAVPEENRETPRESPRSTARGAVVA